MAAQCRTVDGAFEAEPVSGEPYFAAVGRPSQSLYCLEARSQSLDVSAQVHNAE